MDRRSSVPPLELDELKLVLGLVRTKRRKREKEDAKMRQREGQPIEEFHAFAQSHARTLAFLRRTEDHLIRLVAEIDETELWGREQRRLAELRDAS